MGLSPKIQCFKLSGVAVDVLVWVLTVVVAAVFLFAGVQKLTRPKAALVASGLAALDDYSTPQIKALGLAEVLGAVGLVLPAATGVASFLTPVAALCLGIIMIAAIGVQVRRHDTPVPPIIFGVLALTLAVLRFGPYR
jgi:uncharacterized membrane protein YphA (DoxX/SURF4 family)